MFGNGHNLLDFIGDLFLCWGCDSIVTSVLGTTRLICLVSSFTSIFGIRFKFSSLGQKV